MQDITISIIQADLVWQNAAANRARFAERMQVLRGATDLIVLPEMFTTGFTMQPEQLAESADGPTLAWLREQAASLQAVITGSVAVTAQGRFHNRLYWVRPDGSYVYYDKRHLFRMGKEHEHYAAGTQPVVVDLHGWRICPLVCYDLRFPVWSRLRQKLDYDVLIYVANWPTVRRHPWQTLLQARAIENLSYCIGVNRVGADGNGIVHSGDSVVLDFKGLPLLAASEGEWQGSVTLSHATLQRFRQVFPAHLDADAFQLDI
jgi:predicted amidohydrolase